MTKYITYVIYVNNVNINALWKVTRFKKYLVIGVALFPFVQISNADTE